MTSLPCPEPFLEVRVHDVASMPGLSGLCAGYETGDWRSDQLARHLIEWLPEFALTHKERESLGTHNQVRLLARAAAAIYDTRTASESARENRGEIGEILLHVAIRQVFDTLPAISKFYFKNAANKTVEGFDAVHVVATDDSLELWLGEVKFYKDVSSAISAVVSELAAHTTRDYLRSEFAFIVNKIDDTWPHAGRLKRLLDRNTSLDDVFDCMVIPVFLTYESPTVQFHTELNDEFITAFDAEVRQHYGTFVKKSLPENVRIHLFLLPMKCKQSLVEAFDRRLASCQSIGN